MGDRHKNRGGHNKIDLVGRVFDKLTVLSDTGMRKTRRPIWLCQCECGKKTKVLSKYLLTGDTRSCGCLQNPKGNAHNRTGYKSVNGSYWYHIKQNAVKRGIPFEITAQQAYELWKKQENKCAVSGLPIMIVDSYRDDGTKQTASIDRIDSLKGYIVDNIHWVDKRINVMKNRWSMDEFLYLCKTIVEFNELKAK